MVKGEATASCPVQSCPVFSYGTARRACSWPWACVGRATADVWCQINPNNGGSLRTAPLHPRLPASGPIERRPLQRGETHPRWLQISLANPLDLPDHFAAPPVLQPPHVAHHRPLSDPLVTGCWLSNSPSARPRIHLPLHCRNNNSNPRRVYPTSHLLRCPLSLAQTLTCAHSHSFQRTAPSHRHRHRHRHRRSFICSPPLEPSSAPPYPRRRLVDICPRTPRTALRLCVKWRTDTATARRRASASVALLAIPLRWPPSPSALLVLLMKEVWGLTANLVYSLPG
jgi:hypothetical protein